MKGWKGWVLVVGAVALVSAGLGFDAWKLEGRTLAAAGQVGDAFAIFGLAALGVAIVSLRVQQKELSSQAEHVMEQGKLQQVEIETLKAQARAIAVQAEATAAQADAARQVADLVRRAGERQSLRELASAYRAWIDAVYILIPILWEEDKRQDKFLHAGSVPTPTPTGVQRQMREARERISAAEFSLRVLEDEQHRGLIRQLHEVGRTLPEPLQCIGGQLTHEDAAQALEVFREVLQKRQWELARLVYRTETRLGLTPLSGDDGETASDPGQAADGKSGKST